MNITIAAIETALPPNRLYQSEVLEHVKKILKPPPRSMELYERFLLDDSIQTRHFGWDDFEKIVQENVDEKMARFQKVAVGLAVEALDRVLRKSGHSPAELDAIFIATCTGYLCPGLTSYVVEESGLRSDIHALDIVGVGCAGGLSALRTAQDYLTAHAGSTVAVIAVEICTAAVDWGNAPELILSNCIFSDGAAAVLMTNEPNVEGLIVTQGVSLLLPHYRDQLRFQYRNSHLSNVISPRVPVIAAQAVHHLHGELQREGDEICYAFHSGGRRVLDTIEQTLGLTSEQMLSSRNVLKHYGNISSPSVLFAMKDILYNPIMGRKILAFSFGAGFSAFGISAVPDPAPDKKKRALLENQFSHR